MITRIKAENFRCLRSVDVPLRPFQIFVGPNGSGKSALMDVLAFLQTLTADHLDAAVAERTDNFHDLVWGREGNEFTLSVDAAPLPDSWPTSNKDGASPFVRYEVTIRADVLREVVTNRTGKIRVHRGSETLTIASGGARWHKLNVLPQARLVLHQCRTRSSACTQSYARVLPGRIISRKRSGLESLSAIPPSATMAVSVWWPSKLTISALLNLHPGTR